MSEDAEKQEDLSADDWAAAGSARDYPVRPSLHLERQPERLR